VLLSLPTATPTPDIYPLSLHDALPIYLAAGVAHADPHRRRRCVPGGVLQRFHAAEVDRRLDLPRVPAHAVGADLGRPGRLAGPRSEEHTSELQSLTNLVCRLLLEKKNN